MKKFLVTLVLVIVAVCAIFVMPLNKKSEIKAQDFCNREIAMVVSIEDALDADQLYDAKSVIRYWEAVGLIEEADEYNSPATTDSSKWSQFKDWFYKEFGSIKW